MAFGQAAGPPAGQRQVAELEALLEARGYDSFKEARHPFGLNQRQAAGRFTVAEADELAARLEAEAEAGDDGPPAAPAAVVAPKIDAKRRQKEEELVVRLQADIMATELTNRGWCCIPPPVVDGVAGD
jgi:hypothetical protein